MTSDYPPALSGPHSPGPRLEYMMSEHPTDRSWQDDLVARYPDLFVQEINGRATAPGYPTCGDGWRDLVETAVGRIAAAVASAPSGSVGIRQIKEKFGALRLYWHGRNNLTGTASAAVEEAVSLAEARSACTCERCGNPGRLYKRGGQLLTACDEHARGEVVKVRTGRENIHIVRTLKDGLLRIGSCRRYIRETDSFVDVPPAELGIEE